jgi:hypothetical protein
MDKYMSMKVGAMSMKVTPMKVGVDEGRRAR